MADRSSGFGARLREARERRGVTLRQIANATKISVSALEALERDDISRLPGGIFSRAFVRSYAVEVGLDPETAIQDFIAQFPHDSVKQGHPTSEQVEDHEALESDRRTASTFLRLIAFSVPLAAVMLYLGTSGRLSQKRRPPAEPAPAAKPVPSRAAATTHGDPSAASPSPAPTAAPAAAPRDGSLLVALSTTRPVWVSATVDGRKQFERLLQPGDRQTLDVRRELVMTAGDAAAVTMTINGAAARPLGKDGEVVTARVNLSNFKTFLPSR